MTQQKFTLHKFNSKIKVASQFRLPSSNFDLLEQVRQIKVFTSHERSPKDKFKLWKHIDRLALQRELLKVASDPVAKIAGELYDLTETNTEQWASVITLQSAFANSALQSETVQSIPPFLVSVWNNYLTSDEQFIFFFKLMTRRQQARLWNGLVFPFNYFLNTDSARCRLNDMIKAVNFRTKKSIQDGQGDGRSIYTASVMRDLWRQMTGKPSSDFWDKLKLKDPNEKNGPREDELAEDQARQVCAFVEVISQTCKDL